jgi:hypothetical protein
MRTVDTPRIEREAASMRFSGAGARSETGGAVVTVVIWLVVAVWIVLPVARTVVSPHSSASHAARRCDDIEIDGTAYPAYRWSPAVSCTTARKVLGAVASGSGTTRADATWGRVIVYGAWTCSAPRKGDQMCGRSLSDLNRGRWLFHRPACFPAGRCPAPPRL